MIPTSTFNDNKQIFRINSNGNNFDYGDNQQILTGIWESTIKLGVDNINATY